MHTIFHVNFYTLKCKFIALALSAAYSSGLIAGDSTGDNYGKAVYCAGQGLLYSEFYSELLNKHNNPQLNVLVLAMHDIKNNAKFDAINIGMNKGLNLMTIDAAILDARLVAARTAVSYKNNFDAESDALWLSVMTSAKSMVRQCSAYISKKTLNKVNAK